MMKTKKKQDPLSRKGQLGIIKKVIILLVTMIISLSILTMPCLVGSSLCAPSEVSAKTLADGRNRYIEDILNGRIQELKDEGYVEVSYELNPIVQQVGVSLRTAPMATTGNLEEDMKQAVLKNYLFYANYSSVSENEETIYYFKTPELSDNFITEINKYDKTDFKTETVKKIIGAETSQEILDNAIESKRIIAEKREAARRKEEEARRAEAQRQAQSSQIHDTSPVSDNAVVSYALQFRGNPYVYGGTSLTNGADCSGFVQSIYKHFGVSLPRTASAQASAGRYVSWGDLQPGDLVFYSGNGGQSVTHVAIYIGNSQIIHASTPSGGIKTSSVNIMTKMTARRVI